MKTRYCFCGEALGVDDDTCHNGHVVEDER